MRVRQTEQPIPDELPAPSTASYFAPKPSYMGDSEWRLHPQLRTAAKSADVVKILTNAVVAKHKDNLVSKAPLPRGFLPGFGLALADLAVTGRRAFADFVAKKPQEGDQFETDALAELRRQRLPGVTAESVRRATTSVLDRAYRVAWFLCGATARGDLGWIAVSGEDDLPGRPVNVPRTPYPQHELIFEVPGDLGPVTVQTRYAIATAADPPTPPPYTPRRTMPPPDAEPTLPESDRIILFINGSDSRLEEADVLIPKLVRLPDGRPSGFTVISMDMPGSGYVNPIGHKEVGAWPLSPAMGLLYPPYTGLGPASFSMLLFLEQFILKFVAALSMRLGRPGLVESRMAAVIGGSLGGNLALRLARRGSWIRNAVAWSSGSIWQATALDLDRGPIEAEPVYAAFQVGAVAADLEIDQPEADSSRGDFFASVFDKKIPFKTQPEQWYRDDFPWKQQYIDMARMDRRETYTPQFRDWHWRVSLEELVWTWKDPTVQDFRSRLLLGAGAADDIIPAHIFSNTHHVATRLSAVNGDSFFFDHTGHSIHAERPQLLASRILGFLAEDPALVWPRLQPAISLLLS
jgi:pimeloyl-ACP methyl ester carboxylesterase